MAFSSRSENASILRKWALKIERGHVNELGEPLGTRGARVLVLEQLLEVFDRPLRALLQTRSQ